MKSEIIRGEMLGVPVDFEIKTELVGDTVHMTLECCAPKIKWDAERGHLLVLPPPLRPPRITERERREMELMGFIEHGRLKS